MQSEKFDKKKPNPNLIFTFYCVLGAYPVLSFLWRRSYPFLTAEVFLLLAIIIILGLVLTTIFFRVRPGVTVLLTTLMVLVAGLIQFNLRLEGVFILTVMVTPLVWFLESRFYQIGLPVLVAVTIGAWADSFKHPDDFDYSGSMNSGESGIPPVIHVLLDGFIGIDGLPPYPATSIFKKEVNRFFQKYGFRTFPRAYSRYPGTGDSLYAAMNFRDDGSNKFILEVHGRQEHILDSNAYFDRLEDSGYRFNIYQTTHLNFCQSHPDSTDKCWNYLQPNVLSVREVPGIFKRTGMLAKVMISQSFLLKRVSWGLIFDLAIAVHDPEVFEVLQRDVLAEPEGRVFFAHLLIPHNPFVYLHDCTVRYESNPALSYALVNTDKDVSPELIEYRTMRYFEQAECALVTLRQMFEEMKSEGVFDQSFIVIHGDHGSQISRRVPKPRNLKTLTGEDYRALYSTLFAVKFPYGEYYQDTRTLALSALLEEFSSAVTSGVGGPLTAEEIGSLPQYEGETEPFIFLVDPKGLHKVNIDIFEE